MFLGVLATSYQSLLGQISKDKLAPFKRAAWLAVAVFVIGLTSLTTSIVWLIADGGRSFYIATLALFFALLVGLVTVAGYSARVLLR